MKADEAIAILNGAQAMVLNRNPDKFVEAVNQAILALDRVRQMDNRGWIPVTEKLPTTDGRFMVTIKSRRGKPHVEMRNFNAAPQKWETEYGWPQENVLAWQARPRPYRHELKEE